MASLTSRKPCLVHPLPYLLTESVQIAQSHKTALPTPPPQTPIWSITYNLRPTWLQIWGSHNPFLGFDNLLEQLTKLRKAFNWLLSIYCKGCSSGTAKWKDCLGQCIGLGTQSSHTLQASLRRHEWLHHWSLVIGFGLQPLSPPGRSRDGAESFHFNPLILWLVPLAFSLHPLIFQEGLSKNYLITTNSAVFERALLWITKLTAPLGAVWGAQKTNSITEGPSIALFT